MSGNKLWSCLLLSFCAICLLGWQVGPNVSDYLYPMEGYFSLSGNFGELRPNHFHAGLDIKTGGRIGIPVQAIEEGYVYRIKVSPYSYGNAVYLRHPDGNFSVYAHLDRFPDEIAEVVYDRQWETERYAQEIYLDSDRLLVKKGEIIGYSGNSGSSQGPHLHFEIRDPQERIMNPLPFYKEKLSDGRPPTLLQIALVPLSPHARIDGTYDKKVFELLRTRDGYKLRKPVEVSGPIGLQYRAYDLLDGATNWCGINEVKLYEDDQLSFALSLQKFAFDETKYINVHLDYKYLKAQKRYFEKAYVEPGNKFSAYEKGQKAGVLRVQEGETKKVKLELADMHENLSTFSMELVGATLEDPELEYAYRQQPSMRYSLADNVLKVSVRYPKEHHLDGLWIENAFGDKHVWTPAYRKGIELVYLMELDPYRSPRKIIDQSGELSIELPRLAAVSREQNRLVDMEPLQLFFPANAVFKESYIPLSIEEGEKGMLGPQFEIGQENVPLFQSFMLNVKLPTHNLKGKAAIMKWDKDWDFVGAELNDEGKVFARSSTFGRFCVMLDSIAPEIRPQNFRNGSRITKRTESLRLSVNDELTGIRHNSIRGTLDGVWILFEYDYKRKRIVHNFRNWPEPGLHKLKIVLKDGAGNEASEIYELNF